METKVGTDLGKDDDAYEGREDILCAVDITGRRSKMAIYYHREKDVWQIRQYVRDVVVYEGSLESMCNWATKIDFEDGEYIPASKEEIRERIEHLKELGQFEK